jgi:Rrf2 family protein
MRHASVRQDRLRAARAARDVVARRRQAGQRRGARRLQGIPHGFLQAILADLRKAGVVIAQRGQSGGWRMNRDPKDVSVADVIRAVDGPLVSVYGVRPESVSYNEKAEVLQLVWIAARSSLRDVFENGQPRRPRHRQPPEAVTSRTADEDAWQPH